MTDALAQGIAAIIQHLGTTPILLAITVWVLGPLAAVVWVVFKLNKIVGRISSEQGTRMQNVFDRQDQRFEQVVQMYKDNVALVKDYEKHVESQRDTTDKLIDLIAVSTGTQQTLVDYIKNNWWCPVSKDPSLIKLLKEKAQ